MSSTHLSTYLNDHLAGAVMALELLEDVAHRYSDCGALARALKVEVAADRKQLEMIMDKVEVPIGVVRRFSAWTMEKLSQAKMRVDDPATGPLRLLESLEALSLGIEGKRILWIGLATASEEFPPLCGPDYKHLQQRAEDQRAQVEALRLRIVKKALQSSS